MHQKDQFLYKRQLSSNSEVHHSRRRQARKKQLLPHNAGGARFPERFLGAGRGSHLFTCIRRHPCGESAAGITLPWWAACGMPHVERAGRARAGGRQSKVSDAGGRGSDPGAGGPATRRRAQVRRARGSAAASRTSWAPARGELGRFRAGTTRTSWPHARRGKPGGCGPLSQKPAQAAGRSPASASAPQPLSRRFTSRSSRGREDQAPESTAAAASRRPASVPRGLRGARPISQQRATAVRTSGAPGRSGSTWADGRGLLHPERLEASRRWHPNPRAQSGLRRAPELQRRLIWENTRKAGLRPQLRCSRPCLSRSLSCLICKVGVTLLVHLSSQALTTFQRDGGGEGALSDMTWKKDKGFCSKLLFVASILPVRGEGGGARGARCLLCARGEQRLSRGSWPLRLVAPWGPDI